MNKKAGLIVRLSVGIPVYFLGAYFIITKMSSGLALYILIPMVVAGLIFLIVLNIIHPLNGLFEKEQK